MVEQRVRIFGLRVGCRLRNINTEALRHGGNEGGGNDECRMLDLAGMSEG